MGNKVTKAEMVEIKSHLDLCKDFSNGEITVYWRPNLCIHSANCVIGLPGVFNNKKRPLINIHAAGSKEIMKVIDTCPSRALVYHKNPKYISSKAKKNGSKRPKFARIQLLKDGPLLIKGNFILRDVAKKKIKIEKQIISLCRCGSSKRKPFCDGSHITVGFTG